MSDPNERDTVPLTLADVLHEVRLIGQAVTTIADEVARLSSRVLELADNHGGRLRDLERANEVRTNGHG